MKQGKNLDTKYSNRENNEKANRQNNDSNDETNNSISGRLLRSIREALNLSEKEVCYGLCNERTYQRFENGEREPDRFMLEIFLERMGGSVQLYGTTYSLEEYVLFEQRNEILQMLWDKDWKRTEELLREHEKELADCRKGKPAEGNQKLHEQFIRYIRAAITLGCGFAKRQEKKPVDLEEELLEILRLTVPDFCQKRLLDYLYGEQEQAIIVLLAENVCCQGRLEEGCSLYQELLTYLEQRLLDKKRLNPLYPEVVLALARNLAENGQYQELEVCQKGIACLREQQQTAGLENLMKLSLLGFEHGVLLPQGESPELSRKLLWVFEEIRQEYEVWLWSQEQPYPLLRSFYRGQLIGERILRLRLSLGLSQEDLCIKEKEDERTIRRIEHGETKPNRKRFAQLMERLGADTCRFYPVIRADDYALYLAVIELERRMASFEYEAAERELVKLEESLDPRDRINLQFLKRERAVIDLEFGRITKEEEIRRLWEALHLTVPEGVDLSLWPLTKAEAEILNCISITLEEIGDRAGAIELLQKVKKRYEIKMEDLVHFRKEPTGRFARNIIRYRKEGMRLEYNADAYLLVIDNLASYIGNDKRYEEATEMKEKEMKMACNIGKATIISDFLYGIAWDKEQMLSRDGESMEKVKEVCLPLYLKSYLLDVMLKQKVRAEGTKKRCEEVYGQEWIQLIKL